MSWVDNKSETKVFVVVFWPTNVCVVELKPPYTPMQLGKFHRSWNPSATFFQRSPVGCGMYSSMRWVQMMSQTSLTISATVDLPIR